MKIIWPETRQSEVFCDPVLEVGNIRLYPHQIGVMISTERYQIKYSWVVEDMLVFTEVELSGNISRHPHRNRYLGVKSTKRLLRSEKKLSRTSRYRIVQDNRGLDAKIARVRELHRQASGLVVN